MKTCPAATARVAVPVALLTMVASASAQTAYVPEWTKESHYIYQTLRVSPNDDLFTDITARSVDELPLTATLSDASAVTRADANVALNHADGRFTLFLNPVASSVGATIDEYGYALSEGGVFGSFIANTTALNVNYSINGLMYANNPENVLTYASTEGSMFIRDVLLGDSSKQSLDWIQLYDDNDDGSGTFAYALQSGGTWTVPLTVGREYAFGFYIYADALSTGTADAGIQATINLDFSVPQVPEPSQAAMTALGLLCLAGVLRIKPKREI